MAGRGWNLCYHISFFRAFSQLPRSTAPAEENARPKGGEIAGPRLIKQILDRRFLHANSRWTGREKGYSRGCGLVINPFDANASKIALQLKGPAKGVHGNGPDPGRRDLRKGPAPCPVHGLRRSDLAERPPPRRAGFLRNGKGHRGRDHGKRGRRTWCYAGVRRGLGMGQVGCLVAEELSLPCVTVVPTRRFRMAGFASGGRRTGARKILETALPVLATVTSSSLNQPRYPTAKGIVMAGRKKMAVWSARDLGLAKSRPAWWRSKTSSSP